MQLSPRPWKREGWLILDANDVLIADLRPKEPESVFECWLPNMHISPGERSSNVRVIAIAPELLAACEAEEDADAWDRAMKADTIREAKLLRIPIHERWYEQICQEFDCLHFNDSDQLRRLAKLLRRKAIAKATGNDKERAS